MLLDENERQWAHIEGTNFDISNDGLIRKVHGIQGAYLYGYLMKPNKNANGYQSTGYYLHIGHGKYRRFTIRATVYQYFGIDLETDSKWLAYVKDYIKKYNERNDTKVTKKEVKKKKKLNSKRKCRECGYALPSGYWRTCPECLKQLVKQSDELRICA